MDEDAAFRRSGQTGEADSQQDASSSVSHLMPQGRPVVPLSVPSLIQMGIQPPHRLSQQSPDIHLPRPIANPFFEGPFADSEVLASDESAGYPSPADRRSGPMTGSRHRSSFRSATSIDRVRESFATNGASGSSGQGTHLSDFLHKAPTENCCYKFLAPVLPYIRNIIPASVACELLDIFLTEPGSLLFRVASPYILTRIYRKKSITHETNPRYTTPALLATILWCVAQTADVMILNVPGSRAKIVNDLYDLATSLVSDRDPDRWRRIHGMVTCPFHSFQL